MNEPAPFWLRALSFPPVMYLAAGVLVPIATVWLVVLLLLIGLGWMFQGVHVAGHRFGLDISNPFRRAATALSSGLYDALRGWFDEVRRRYGDGA